MNMVGLAFSRIQLDKEGGLLEVAVISESGLLLMISNGCVKILGQKRNDWLTTDTGFF
jgi:hypothetical protein